MYMKREIALPPSPYKFIKFFVTLPPFRLAYVINEYLLI